MSARPIAARRRCRTELTLLLALGLVACSGSSAPPTTAPDARARLLIIGQDLGAIRGYVASDCCPHPDGVTAYVDLYDILKQGEHSFLRIDDILVPIRDNFDLAPSNGMLSAIEQELSGVNGRESRLLHAIQSLRKTYDFIIIDCPPSLGSAAGR